MQLAYTIGATSVANVGVLLPAGFAPCVLPVVTAATTNTAAVTVPVNERDRVMATPYDRAAALHITRAASANERGRARAAQGPKVNTNARSPGSLASRVSK